MRGILGDDIVSFKTTGRGVLSVTRSSSRGHGRGRRRGAATAGEACSGQARNAQRPRRLGAPKLPDRGLIFYWSSAGRLEAGAGFNGRGRPGNSPAPRWWNGRGGAERNGGGPTQVLFPDNQTAWVAPDFMVGGLVTYSSLHRRPVGGAYRHFRPEETGAGSPR